MELPDVDSAVTPRILSPLPHSSHHRFPPTVADSHRHYNPHPQHSYQAIIDDSFCHQGAVYGTVEIQAPHMFAIKAGFLGVAAWRMGRGGGMGGIYDGFVVYAGTISQPHIAGYRQFSSRRQNQELIVKPKNSTPPPLPQQTHSQHLPTPPITPSPPPPPSSYPHPQHPSHPHSKAYINPPALTGHWIYPV